MKGASKLYEIAKARKNCARVITILALVHLCGVPSDGRFSCLEPSGAIRVWCGSDRKENKGKVNLKSRRVSGADNGFGIPLLQLVYLIEHQTK